MTVEEKVIDEIERNKNKIKKIEEYIIHYARRISSDLEEYDNSKDDYDKRNTLIEIQTDCDIIISWFSKIDNLKNENYKLEKLLSK